jgi:hypothetical protein
MSNAPWIQQPRESAASYQAFIAYRNLGARRSLEKVAAGAEAGIQKGPECTPDVPQESALPSLANLKKLCRRHRWVDRVAAWDAHLQAEKDLIREQLAREREEWELTRQREFFEDSRKARDKALLALDLMQFIEKSRKTVVKEYEDGRPHITNIEVFKHVRPSLKDVVLALRLAQEMRDEASGHNRGETQTPGLQTPRGPMFMEAPRDGPLTVDVEEVTREPVPPPIGQPQSNQPPFPNTEE